MIVCVPSVPGLGAYVSEQALAEELVELRVQADEGEKEPELLAANDTVPVGAVGELEVSVTVAVHVVMVPTTKEPGSQITPVVVGAPSGAPNTAPMSTQLVWVTVNGGYGKLLDVNSVL